MNEMGFGRLTFNLDFDENGRLRVHKFASPEPAQFFYPLDDVPLFLTIRDQVEKAFRDPRAKRAVWTAFSKYDPKLKKLVANNARGGGGTAECGTAGLWTWPSSLGGVFAAFSDRTPINMGVIGDEGDGRRTAWGLAGTYVAVMLHELQHTWRLPHSRDPYDVISGRGFRTINRYFTFVEPPCKNNPRYFEFPDSEVSYIAPISACALKNSRWFTLDDKPWKDGGAPRITAGETDGDILVEAEHGLGYIGIDVKGDAVAYKSWGQNGSDPPRSYLLTAMELKELAETTDVRIRAVDLEDQQTEIETKNLGRDTNVCPTSNEATEIDVPDKQKLVLDVHFNFPSASPEADVDVYLRNTKERVFVANAYGDPNQHWESSVNTSGKPIAYSIVGYYKIRGKIEEPWRIAHKKVTERTQITDIAFGGRRDTTTRAGNPDRTGSNDQMEAVDVSTARVEVK
jgi:Putative peptidase family